MNKDLYRALLHPSAEAIQRKTPDGLGKVSPSCRAVKTAQQRLE